MWGTVGSGLTPGSRLGRRTGSGTDGSGSRTEKRFQTVLNGSAHFTAKLRHLGPHVGYPWVWADPRITPGPAEPLGTERFWFQNRKTVPNSSAHFCFITEKSKIFASCIYIILQKAMRPIGRSPASIFKLHYHLNCIVG